MLDRERLPSYYITEIDRHLLGRVTELFECPKKRRLAARLFKERWNPIRCFATAKASAKQDKDRLGVASPSRTSFTKGTIRIFGEALRSLARYVGKACARRQPKLSDKIALLILYVTWQLNDRAAPGYKWKGLNGRRVSALLVAQDDEEFREWMYLVHRSLLWIADRDEPLGPVQDQLLCRAREMQRLVQNRRSKASNELEKIRLTLRASLIHELLLPIVDNIRKRSVGASGEMSAAAELRELVRNAANSLRYAIKPAAQRSNLPMRRRKSVYFIDHRTITKIAKEIVTKIDPLPKRKYRIRIVENELHCDGRRAVQLRPRTAWMTSKLLAAPMHQLCLHEFFRSEFYPEKYEEANRRHLEKIRNQLRQITEILASYGIRIRLNSRHHCCWMEELS